MENEIINSEILKVWDEFPAESGEYLPVLYPEFKKGGLLFIGLNPSFSDRVFNKILKGTEYEKINIKEKLSKKSNDYGFIFLIERRAKDVCDYFTKFHEISKKLGLHFQHIDLFYFRETDQKKVKKIIYDEKENLINFALRQLNIAIKIIEEIDPKSIIVVNALASDIINKLNKQKLIKINEEEFDKNGYDFLEINNKKIPIIFSSMLTGQRALDKHSLRRLIWIIGKSIKEQT